MFVVPICSKFTFKTRFVHVKSISFPKNPRWRQKGGYEEQVWNSIYKVKATVLSLLSYIFCCERSEQRHIPDGLSVVSPTAGKHRDLFGSYVCRQKILSLAFMHGPVTCSAVLVQRSQSDETPYLHAVYATNIFRHLAINVLYGLKKSLEVVIQNTEGKTWTKLKGCTKK